MTNLLASIGSPEFIHALMLAVLPHISDFAARLELPISQPITTNSVKSFGYTRDFYSCSVVLTNNYTFWFERGYVSTMRTPASYYCEQNPDNIPKYYGKVNFDKKKAEQIARSALSKLGYSPEMVYADLPPSIEPPNRSDSHTIARYRIAWHDPRTQRETAYFEINSESGDLTYLHFLCSHLNRPFNVPGYPEIKVDRFASYDKLTTDEFPLAQTRVLTAIEDFTRKLDIPVLYPVTTNMIMQQEYRWRSGLLLAELALTNGMFFKFEWGIITEFETKQHYNVAHRGIFLKDFYGPWKLSEKQALKVARDNLVKLGYDPKDFGLNEKPKIRKPTIPNIPRFVFNWDKGTGGVALYYYATEINAATGGVEALSAFTPKIAKEFPQKQRSQTKPKNERAVLKPASAAPLVTPSSR